MPLRTYAKPVGILIVKSLGELKMTDEKVIVFEIAKIGAVGATPDNRIYWSNTQDPLLWANVAATINTWEMKVDFHD
jgi:hypothetical protein